MTSLSVLAGRTILVLVHFVNRASESVVTFNDANMSVDANRGIKILLLPNYNLQNFLIVIIFSFYESRVL